MVILWGPFVQVFVFVAYLSKAHLSWEISVRGPIVKDLFAQSRFLKAYIILLPICPGLLMVCGPNEKAVIISFRF